MSVFFVSSVNHHVMYLHLHVLVEVLKLPIGFLSREEWPIKLPTKSHGKKALGFCFAILLSSHPLLQCFLSLKNDPLLLEDDRRLLIIGLISTFKVSSHDEQVKWHWLAWISGVVFLVSLVNHFELLMICMDIFLGIVYFLQNLLALSSFGLFPCLWKGFDVQPESTDGLFPSDLLCAKNVVTPQCEIGLYQDLVIPATNFHN
ncbi:hypothetical protein Peur_061789 [Populus x canadensis]